MKHLRSSNSKPLGFLGLIAAALGLTMTIVIATTDGSPLALGLGFVIVIYFAGLGWLGATAQNLSVGDGKLRLRSKKEAQAFSIEDVIAVRTLPVFRHVDAIWIRLSSGRRLRTLIATHDLSATMEAMPVSALTAYWQQRRS